MIEPCDRTNANQFTLENRHYFQRYQQVVGGRGRCGPASFIAQSISLFNITFIAFRKIKTWNPWTEAETMAINAAFMTHIQPWDCSLSWGCLQSVGQIPCPYEKRGAKNKR